MVSYIWIRLPINEIKIQIFTVEDSGCMLGCEKNRQSPGGKREKTSPKKHVHKQIHHEIAALVKKANFKMKAYLADKFNERRCYIYFLKRSQGNV